MPTHISSAKVTIKIILIFYYFPILMQFLNFRLLSKDPKRTRGNSFGVKRIKELSFVHGTCEAFQT